MYSTKKSLTFNPEKAAEGVSKILSPNEKIFGIFLATSKLAIFTNARVATLQIMNHQLESSVPLKDIKDLIQGGNKAFGLSSLRPNFEVPKISFNPLKNPIPNPLKAADLSPLKLVNSFAIELANGDLVPLGQFSKQDWESIQSAFAEARANQIDVENLEISTKASRAADYANIECNMSWSKVPSHLQKNIEINIGEDEKPLFIIATEGARAGAIVALPTRCMLIKSGGLAGFMAGSLGGARVATFYYSDITGIEYNSGMMTGVVEILTSSYEGGKNKDYWRGTTKSRNSDSNDPWTLSNTLPMVKPAYGAAKKQFDKLRSLIGESKGSSSVTNIINSDSIADEIEKLSKLLEKNLIDENEFKEAKKRLLGN